ncbi:MAG: hypothetical protein CYPHOPRED_003596 [Cyphobasidiales sp. Tagirdzhanova-0007]|nr:MAG: hypothetical protein CYPHOPRED_003596 [Cyphobasidiales sp. Tagirdzhanova-0007]
MIDRVPFFGMNQISDFTFSEDLAIVHGSFARTQEDNTELIAEKVSNMVEVELTAARYGKETVRFLRVVREGSYHKVAEYTVRVMIEGQIEAAFTDADNSVVVATDTIKNTIHLKAKQSKHVMQPETFALELGLHFVRTYPHFEKAFVDITQLRWSRMIVNDKLHPHSFIRDGEDKRFTSVTVDATHKGGLTATITSGIVDWLVLKTTGSAFENFQRDEYTTIAELSDRVLSTAIDCSYSITLPDTALSIQNLDRLEIPFDGIHESVRKITLDTFALDESPSVQATVYNMAKQIIEQNPAVATATYRLPNKHYLAVNLSWYKGVENMLPKNAEVFTQAEFS